MTDGDEPMQFNGTYQELRRVLEAIAREHPGKWARRRKPNGTLIAMRISTSRNQWQFSIGHDTAPSTFMGKARREAEIREIRRDMSVQHWTACDDVFEGESVAATFTVPLNLADARLGRRA